MYPHTLLYLAFNEIFYVIYKMLGTSTSTRIFVKFFHFHSLLFSKVREDRNG